MTDRELLEAAAREAGVKVDWRESVNCLCYSGSPYNDAWNPLTDDGDALRLVVALSITVVPDPIRRRVYAVGAGIGKYEEWGKNRAAATRRALVRAAAASGGRHD